MIAVWRSGRRRTRISRLGGGDLVRSRGCSTAALPRGLMSCSSSPMPCRVPMARSARWWGWRWRPSIDAVMAPCMTGSTTAGSPSTGCGARWPGSRCPAPRTADWSSRWMSARGCARMPPTSPGRLFCHTYGRGHGRAQMIPGWPYSIIAALEPGRTSWTAVLDTVRLGPDRDATEVTAAQIREVIARLRGAGHHHDGDPDILVVLDALAALRIRRALDEFDPRPSWMAAIMPLTWVELRGFEPLTP